MTESFDFRELEFLTVGTLGPKGQREFFLQARGEGQLVSLKIEKQQVAALADYLDRVLEDLLTRRSARPPMISPARAGGTCVGSGLPRDRLRGRGRPFDRDGRRRFPKPTKTTTMSLTRGSR